MKRQTQVIKVLINHGKTYDVQENEIVQFLNKFEDSELRLFEEEFEKDENTLTHVINIVSTTIELVDFLQIIFEKFLKDKDLNKGWFHADKYSLSMYHEIRTSYY